MMMLCVLDGCNMSEDPTDIYILEAEDLGPYLVQSSRPSCGIASYLLR
jgi:hypothetical protein